MTRPIEEIRIALASKRIEVAILVRELETAVSTAAGLGHASLYAGLGVPPWDPKGCQACRGTGLQAGPYG
jgi:hypothetical protein